MKKYRVVYRDDDNLIDVIEKTAYGVVRVKTFTKRSDADKLCSQLNNGSGFAGFLPLFMAERTAQS